MKRYDIKGKGVQLMPSSDGIWVLYKDAIEMAEDCVLLACGKAVDSDECTCKENVDSSEVSAWICPAHGYKRL